MSKPSSWLIFYEDADKNPEVFAGEGAETAAIERFTELSWNWNVTLFKSIAENHEAEVGYPEINSFGWPV